MCQILVSFFEMGNVVYSSFIIEILCIVNALFFALLDPINLCG